MKDKGEGMMKKSRLAAAYKKIQDPPVRKALLGEYRRLRGEADLIDNDKTDRMLAHHLDSAILPAVAFYRVLVQQGRT
jgi:hypothetical protein